MLLNLNNDYLQMLTDVILIDNLSITAGWPVNDTNCDASTSLLYSEPIMNLFFALSWPRLITKMSVKSLVVLAGTMISGALMVTSSFTLEVFLSLNALAYSIGQVICHHFRTSYYIISTSRSFKLATIYKANYFLCKSFLYSRL